VLSAWAVFFLLAAWLLLPLCFVQEKCCRKFRKGVFTQRERKTSKDMIISVILAIRMSGGRLVGILVALALSLWAAFSFLRSSVTGAPPLYSKGPLQRTLHFIAGIIFAALALCPVVMLVKK
jgi:hypothetical protein